MTDQLPVHDPLLDLRIRARRQARELMAIVDSDVADLPEDRRAMFLRAYCETLVEECRSRLPEDRSANQEPQQRGPMSDRSAKVWAQTTAMTFGKHKGKRVIDVPLSYLVWYSEQRDEFKEDVARYLGSPAVQQELQQQEEDREEREREGNQSADGGRSFW